MNPPKRAEVWWADLDPIRGHEQGGSRPALVLSNDVYNASPAALVVVVPVTTKGRPIRSFLRIDPPEGGLKQVSYLICDQIRTISRERLSRRAGTVSTAPMSAVEERVRVLLDL